MRPVEAIVVLLAMAGGAGWISVRVQAARRQRALRDQPWRLEERANGGIVTVCATRPDAALGKDSLVIGSAKVRDPDFEMRIEELRAEGVSKVAALNSGKRRKL